jgi:glutamate-ammonia-ligase adenylyltransferase
VLRQLVLERLVVLDCDRQAPLARSPAPSPSWPKFALDVACRHACADLDEVLGAPLRADGRRSQLWIVGMGKLGAREAQCLQRHRPGLRLRRRTARRRLRTEGRNRISNHEVFRQGGRRRSSA